MNFCFLSRFGKLLDACDDFAGFFKWPRMAGERLIARRLERAGRHWIYLALNVWKGRKASLLRGGPSMTAASHDLADNDNPRRRLGDGVPAERIDILFRMGRLYLFLPFSALCIASVFYRSYTSLWLATDPLILQIASTAWRRGL